MATATEAESECQGDLWFPFMAFGGLFYPFDDETQSLHESTPRSEIKQLNSSRSRKKNSRELKKAQKRAPWYRRLEEFLQRKEQRLKELLQDEIQRLNQELEAFRGPFNLFDDETQSLHESTQRSEIKQVYSSRSRRKNSRELKKAKKRFARLRHGLEYLYGTTGDWMNRLEKSRYHLRSKERKKKKITEARERLTELLDDMQNEPGATDYCTSYTTKNEAFGEESYAEADPSESELKENLNGWREENQSHQTSRKRKLEEEKNSVENLNGWREENQFNRTFRKRKLDEVEKIVGKASDSKSGSKEADLSKSEYLESEDDGEDGYDDGGYDYSRKELKKELDDKFKSPEHKQKMKSLFKRF